MAGGRVRGPDRHDALRRPRAGPHRRRRRGLRRLQHPRVRRRLPGQPVRADQPTAASSSTTSSASSAARATWCATGRARSRGPTPRAATASSSAGRDRRLLEVGRRATATSGGPACRTPTGPRSRSACGCADGDRRRRHRRDGRRGPGADVGLREALAVGAAPRRARRRAGRRWPARPSPRRSPPSPPARRGCCAATSRPTAAAGRCRRSSPPSSARPRRSGWSTSSRSATAALRAVRRLDGGRREVLDVTRRPCCRSRARSPAAPGLAARRAGRPDARRSTVRRGPRGRSIDRRSIAAVPAPAPGVAPPAGDALARVGRSPAGAWPRRRRGRRARSAGRGGAHPRALRAWGYMDVICRLTTTLLEARPRSVSAVSAELDDRRLAVVREHMASENVRGLRPHDRDVRRTRATS